VAAGPGQYGPAAWFPLRGDWKIGCTWSNGCNGGYHGYYALDIARNPSGSVAGDPVYAAGAGLASVHSTGSNCGGSGTPSNAVVVDHGNGTKSYYYHLQGFNIGGPTWVDQNSIIGFVGHTGYVAPCSFNHLHFEVRNSSGAKVDPGPLKACLGTQLITYPSALSGAPSQWNQVPLWSNVHSDGTSCGSTPPTPSIDELGFVRTNHGSGKTEMVAYHGAPHYTTLHTVTLTGYPTISDPQNVTPLALDVNGDGIDELGFVRTNHSSGRTELLIYHGAPHYTTLHTVTLTGYPAISDPQNVTPLALDVNGDGIDELGFVRSNHSSGQTELIIYHGAPHYTALHTVTLIGYPAISDPQNVTPLALDVNGDKIDELGFVRTNHGSGQTELILYHGAPHYTTLHTVTLTGYPAISDPQNVRPLAIRLP
jgi:hypothetical protein